MSDVVLTEVNDGVMTVTLNRPEAKNAVNLAMAEGIAAAMDELDSNDAIRVAILTGSNNTFCSALSCPNTAVTAVVFPSFFSNWPALDPIHTVSGYRTAFVLGSGPGSGDTVTARRW